MTTECKCQYPLRIRVGDDGFGNRLLYCGKHGFKLMRIGIKVSRANVTTEITIPDHYQWLKWVIGESKRMRRRINKYNPPDKEKRLARLDKIDKEIELQKMENV